MTETKTYCNRCGKEIEKPIRKHWWSKNLARIPITKVEYSHEHITPHLSSETINDLIARNEIKTALVIMEGYAKTEHFDLCKDCHKKFLEFMKNER